MEDTTLLGLASRPFPPGGDMQQRVEGEERFAAAWGTIDDRETFRRQDGLDQPLPIEDALDPRKRDDLETSLFRSLGLFLHRLADVVAFDDVGIIGPTRRW